MKFEDAPGATPLDPDAQAGLIPALSTQAELNEFEERNILAAARWARGSRSLRVDYPNVTALKLLHRRMFDRTWRWAGEFRRVDTNIGIDWTRIPMELHGHCGNTRAWIDYRSYLWDELAVRFHHELVAIHPFLNGNGRHGRLATDILLRQHGQAPFTWGSRSLIAAGAARGEYIAALREADAGLFDRLLAFVRT